MAPFILLPVGYFIFGWPRELIILNIVQIFIILLIKAILAVRFKERVTDILFTPVSVAFIAFVAINSYRQTRFGKGITWKDRTYSEPTENELNLTVKKKK
ncbi:MAG: hypothetical protein FJW66_08880 [Actinobacteria bacterium]|nr:hypothetical protein [Actinomycetota bacterium]